MAAMTTSIAACAARRISGGSRAERAVSITSLQPRDQAPSSHHANNQSHNHAIEQSSNRTVSITSFPPRDQALSSNQAITHSSTRAIGQ
eukprot:4925428-Prymnesium_polylepis.1